MKYHYQFGATRAFKWTSSNDVRLHRPKKGWKAEAIMADYHPMTGKQFKGYQWWIVETYVG